MAAALIPSLVRGRSLRNALKVTVTIVTTTLLRAGREKTQEARVCHEIVPTNTTKMGIPSSFSDIDELLDKQSHARMEQKSPRHVMNRRGETKKKLGLPTSRQNFGTIGPIFRDH